MSLPLLAPLRDYAVRRLWTGLALSSIGAELFNIAVIWLAVEAAGPKAAWVSAAQHGAVLVMGFLAGAVIDRVPAAAAMAGANLARAALVMVPVAVWLLFGPSLVVLIAIAVTVAALRAIFEPVLQGSAPRLLADKRELQALNGLLDTTGRLSRLLSPALAAPLSGLIPVIHFLTLNGAMAFGCALCVISIHDRLNVARAGLAHGWRGAWAGMTAGVRLLREAPTERILLATNIAINAPWLLALALGMALLVREVQPTLFGFGGLAAYSLIMGSYGLGDVLGSLTAASVRFRRPLIAAYGGYLVMGTAYFCWALEAWLIPADSLLPALMLTGVAAGFGGPFFYLPMITRVQLRFGAEASSVFRLRLSLMSGSMLTAALLAPLLYTGLGVRPTIALAGLSIMAAAFWGFWRFRNE